MFIYTVYSVNVHAYSVQLAYILNNVHAYSAQ